MEIRFTSPCEAASEQAIAQVERQLEVRLPSGYLALLEECNGGAVEQNRFEGSDDAPGASVRHFFGVGRSDDADLVKNYEDYRDRVPSWLLPIADDATGNLVCISVRDQDRASVWFWDHEEEAEEGDPPTEDNLHQLADDFEGFLSRLKPLAKEDVPEPEVEEVWVDPAFAEEMRRRGLMR